MSTFGKYLRVTTYGESHSKSVGVIIDNFPPNFKFLESEVQSYMDRRRPGQSIINSPRKELDKINIESGTIIKVQNEDIEHTTLGTAICIRVLNNDIKVEDYNDFVDIPRPGHGDFSYQQKYLNTAKSGGGRSSARETIGRVIAGGLVDLYLQKHCNILIQSFVSQVGSVILDHYDPSTISKHQLEQTGLFIQINHPSFDNSLYYNEHYHTLYDHKGQPIKELEKRDMIEYVNKTIINNTTDQLEINVINIRCPVAIKGIQMIEVIKEIKQEQDSIGGCITTIVSGLMSGLGEPVFDKFEAQLAYAMLSIPATKGFEIGRGFSCASMKGSDHNDVFIKDNLQDKIKQKTNNSGGTLGGITNGEQLLFKVVFKPVSTIGKDQTTTDFQGNQKILKCKGRHDPCVVPRATVIVESMTALVIMDNLLIQRARQSTNVLHYS